MSLERTMNVTPRESACLTDRRRFLKIAGGTVVTLMIAPPWGGRAVAWAAGLAEYERKRIAGLGDLDPDRPLVFSYPDEVPTYSDNLLMKLGSPAGGGVGPDSDVVAFSSLCPHMGGILTSSYDRANQILGPCPVHLSTFDLTRHGMVVAGHSTQSLPQVLLEVEGDDIFAVGVLGLLYGRSHNV